MKEESEKTGLKLNIQETKMMASGPIISWQTEGGKVEAVTDFIFTIFTSCNMPAQMTHKLESRWKNIYNLRYADDTILMAESEEELKSLLMKVK